MTVLLVKGICCPSEVPITEQALGALEGVTEIAVNVPQKKAVVRHDAARASPSLELLLEMLPASEVSAVCARLKRAAPDIL